MLTEKLKKALENYEENKDKTPELERLKNKIFFDRMSSGNGVGLSEKEYAETLKSIKELEK